MNDNLNSDHVDIYAAESAALAPTTWERWISAVESHLGHSADGDIREDGYSMDTFHDMFEAGLAPYPASQRVLGALFVTQVGATYRLASAGSSIYRGDKYGEQYNVLTETGSLGLEFELPKDAVLVWSPDRGPVSVK
jgi:hypothetical protein